MNMDYVSTLIGEKTNHGIVKKPVFFKINVELVIKPTGLSNILAKSIPLSYLPYLLSLTVPEVATIYITATIY